MHQIDYATYYHVPVVYLPRRTVNNLTRGGKYGYLVPWDFRVFPDASLGVLTEAVLHSDSSALVNPIRIGRLNDGRLRVDLTLAGEFTFPDGGYGGHLEAVGLIVVDRNHVGPQL